MGTAIEVALVELHALGGVAAVEQILGGLAGGGRKAVEVDCGQAALGLYGADVACAALGPGDIALIDARGAGAAARAGVDGVAAGQGQERRRGAAVVLERWIQAGDGAEIAGGTAAGGIVDAVAAAAVPRHAVALAAAVAGENAVLNRDRVDATGVADGACAAGSAVVCEGAVEDRDGMGAAAAVDREQNRAIRASAVVRDGAIDNGKHRGATDVVALDGAGVAEGCVTADCAALNREAAAEVVDRAAGGAGLVLGEEGVAKRGRALVPERGAIGNPEDAAGGGAIAQGYAADHGHRAGAHVEDAIHARAGGRARLNDCGFGASAGERDLPAQVEVASGGSLLALAGDGERVDPGRQADRVGARGGVGLLDGGAQGAEAGCGSADAVAGGGVHAVEAAGDAEGGRVDDPRRRGDQADERGGDDDQGHQQPGDKSTDALRLHCSPKTFFVLPTTLAGGPDALTLA